MSFRFDDAIALEQVSERRFRRTTLDQAWNINDAFYNGGYVHALTAAAARSLAQQDDVISMATTFANPVVPGPIELDVTVLAAGRTVTSTLVELSQGGARRASSLVSLGALPTSSEPDQRNPMPDVPAALELAEGRRSAGSSQMPSVVDMRLVPPYDGWTRKDFSGSAELMFWIRFRDDRPLDSMSVAAFSDMGPPVAFALGNFGWAPTLQLHVGNFVAATGQWLLVHATGSPYGSGPFGCEDVDMWDADGQLVGRARQVALLPRPHVRNDGKTGH